MIGSGSWTFERRWREEKTWKGGEWNLDPWCDLLLEQGSNIFAKFLDMQILLIPAPEIVSSSDMNPNSINSANTKTEWMRKKEDWLARLLIYASWQMSWRLVIHLDWFCPKSSRSTEVIIRRFLYAGYLLWFSGGHHAEGYFPFSSNTEIKLKSKQVLSKRGREINDFMLNDWWFDP